MSLANFFRTRNTSRPASRKRPTTKPRLERLEERLALSGFGPEDGSSIVEPWTGGFHDVAIEPGSQKIVTAGIMNDVPALKLSVAVARYDSLGNADSTYGSGGLANPPLGQNSETALSLVLQPDGKAVVSGYDRAAGVGVPYVLGVGRLNTNGSPDTTFGSGGWTKFDVQTGNYSSGAGVGLQSTGKIVVSGDAWNGSPPYTHSAFVARFKTNGAIDSGKGAFGQVAQGKATGATLSTLGFPSLSFGALAIQPDDKVVAVGGFSEGDNARLVVARYTATGALDTTFNSSGYNLFLPAGLAITSGDGVALQADGKIVVAGRCSGSSGGTDMLVTRFNVNGTLDTSFGGGSGFVRFDVDGAANPTAEQARGLAIQPDGKIVVGGHVSGLGSNMFLNPTNVLVVRLNPSGTLDETFGTGGFKLGVLPVNQAFSAHAMTMQSDGTIIVAGYASIYGEANSSHPFLMRFSGTSAAPAAAESSTTSSDAASDAALMLLLGDDVNGSTRRK